MELFRCEQCAHEFWVHAQYLPEPYDLGVPVFRAHVFANSEKTARWNRLKVPKVFGAYSNFCVSTMMRQFEQGLATWDLGLYSEQEVTELRESARQAGLQVEFIQVC